MSLDAGLTYGQKEQKFLGILRAELMTLCYTIAVPQPDTGEDVWFSKLRLKSDPPNLKAAPIYRAQVKSSSSYRQLKKYRRYTLNVELANFEYSLGEGRFVYFFGLRRGPEEKPDYHFGCVPSVVFKPWWDGGLIGAFGKKESRRVRLMLDVSGDGDTVPFSFFFYGGKGCNEDVSPYFRDLRTGVEEAESVSQESKMDALLTHAHCVAKQPQVGLASLALTPD